MLVSEQARLEIFREADVFLSTGLGIVVHSRTPKPNLRDRHEALRA